MKQKDYEIKVNKVIGTISVEGKPGTTYSSYYWSRTMDTRAFPKPEAEAAHMWAELIGEPENGVQ